jgi:hypothetical protein
MLGRQALAMSSLNVKPHPRKVRTLEQIAIDEYLLLLQGACAGYVSLLRINSYLLYQVRDNILETLKAQLRDNLFGTMSTVLRQEMINIVSYFYFITYKLQVEMFPVSFYNRKETGAYKRNIGRGEKSRTGGWCFRKFFAHGVIKYSRISSLSSLLKNLKFPKNLEKNISKCNGIYHVMYN